LVGHASFPNEIQFHPHFAGTYGVFGQNEMVYELLTIEKSSKGLDIVKAKDK